MLFDGCCRRRATDSRRVGAFGFAPRRATASVRGMTRDARRSLPSVEVLLQHDALRGVREALARPLVVAAVRATLAEARAALKRKEQAPSADELAARASEEAERQARPLLRRVLNATGVVLHTNLGRAPLAEAARRAVAEVAAGYCSLEYDVEAGKRGERGAGVERWITRLSGAKAACVVNNGAAAILVALSALASGRKVAVSRGELVEIGGSFRVPEIMEKSGAELVEVGATNRTHLRDYERAFAKHPDIGAILRVHPSNFRVQGFTARPAHEDLAALARKRKVPLIEDLGSGALVDLSLHGLEREPTVGDSLSAGSDVVTFSGDKLLGGPQAGFIVGSAKWIGRIRKDPLARAMRVDKLTLAALEATLALYAEPARARLEVPALAMLAATPEALQERAERLSNELAARIEGLTLSVVEGAGEVGGGALPLERLRGFVVEVVHRSRSASELEALARSADPPVIGTIRSGRLRFDVRTLRDTELGMAATALARVWG